MEVRALKARQDHYLAGMPQLAYSGLSENWMLKECGHHHWLALAAINGKVLPDFVDEAGNKSYAAFTAVRISSARLHGVQENQAFTIYSQLTRAAQARHYSVHEIATESNLVAKVEMLSTFVFRQESGNNQSVMRASFADRLTVSDEVSPEALALIQQSKKMRMGEWTKQMGLLHSSRATINEASFLPCPNNDFNGANFLYFASFQAFVDRAEWAWFRLHDLPSVADREM
jgi:probable biosynthetic protein (TIGR04099 family)